MAAGKIEADLLIRGGTVVTVDSQARVFEQGAVAVRGPDIVAVGPLDVVRAQVEAAAEMDATGMAVLPGLVNAHTHLAMTIFRGLVDDAPLDRWLERIWGMEKTYATAGNVRVGCLLAFAEMIRSGTTTAVDMYWHRDVATELARQVGMRLVNGPAFIDFVGPDGIEPARRMTLAREFLERYRNDPLIATCVQAHATYTVPPELLETTRDLMLEYDVPFVTHASETTSEVATVLERYGRRPVDHLDSLGLLGPKTVLAHGVHLQDEEIRRLAESGASVVHCPQSNLKTGAGIARVADLLQAGVNVALGTDGAASNNDLDLWGEMYFAALLQKGVRQDPTVVPARQALHMATMGGARALALQDRIGSLEPGKRADIILVDLDRPHLTPLYDVYSHLVYAVRAGDVRTVLIHGRPVMRDRVLLTINEEEALTLARRVGRSIAQDLGG